MDEKKIRMEALNDEALEGVNGGAKMQTMPFFCNSCGKIFQADLSKSTVTCSCGAVHRIDG